MLMGEFGAVITHKLQQKEEPQLALTLHHSSVHLQQCPVSHSDLSPGSSRPLLDSRPASPHPPPSNSQRETLVCRPFLAFHSIFSHHYVYFLSTRHGDILHTSSFHHLNSKAAQSLVGGSGCDLCNGSVVCFPLRIFDSSLVALGCGAPQSSVLGRI